MERVLQKNTSAFKIYVMKKTPAYDWFFFDADGTLFDYDLAEDNALESTFSDLELPFAPICRQEYRRINLQIWQDFENGKISSAELRTRRFELLFEAIRLTADPGEFSNRYLVRLSQQAQLIEGAEAVVRELAIKSRLALITNGLSDVQRGRLALSPIADFFDEVAISDELGVAKPNPAYFDAVFERITARFEPPQKHKVLVIGDSLNSDILGGNTYGLDTCWYNPGGKPARNGIVPCYKIRRLEDVIPLAIR